MPPTATASQAWAILKRHAREEISPLRLLELCRDNDRVSSLVTVYNSTATPNAITNNNSNSGGMIMIDFSRQRMTLETLNHLLRLGRAQNIQALMKKLAWGDTENGSSSSNKRGSGETILSDQKQPPYGQEWKINGSNFRNSDSMSSRASRIPYHLTLRAPRGSEMFLSDGVTNAVTVVHQEWDRLQRITESLRRGQLSGVTGQMLQNVVVVGQGVSIQALRFVYDALCKDEQGIIGSRMGISSGRRSAQNHASQRQMKFVSSVDPVRVAAVVEDLDPATTLIVTIALTGTEEILSATALLQSWLFRSLGVLDGRRSVEQVLSKQMMIVSANESFAMQRKPETIFVIPSHAQSEPFSSFSSATLLPLAFTFGWSIVETILQGGHDMDTHFIDTNPRHNLPILLALTDVWNESFLQTSGRLVSPFTEAFAAYPSFCAAIESQTCGNGTSIVPEVSIQVMDGGLHHSFDRALYQSNRSQPTEMLMVLDAQLYVNTSILADSQEIRSAQSALLCSMFAHADELAFGSSTTESSKGFLGPNFAGENKMMASDALFDTPENTSEGNRPSSLLLCSRLDAFACGQFIALAEHRAVIKAQVWGIDPFVHETGLKLRQPRMVGLKELLSTMIIDGISEEEDDNEAIPVMNLSTKTILRHCANILRDQNL